MGLDITAYSNVKAGDPKSATYTLEQIEDGDYYGEFVHVYDAGHFPDSNTTWKDGDYIDVRESKSDGWRAGSYSGYSLFRRALSSISGVTPESIWENEDIYRDSPFYELINFSDCEGIIDAKASANLLEDFITHRDAFMESQKDEEWSFARVYDEWIEGLTLAADNGILVFH